MCEILIYCIFISYFAADNGLNPIWNESCEFEVKFPDIALIRFVVQDEDMFGDTNFIGQATYPVSLLILISYINLAKI